MGNLVEWLYLKQKNNLVYYDQVTKTKSRFYYDKVLKNKYRGKLCHVTFVDIDSLKYVNDHYGHSAGTALIRSISNQLLSLENAIEVCRIGGDEFVIISNANTHLGLQSIQGISYGCYEKEEYEDISSAVKKADERMYKMKKIKHKNRI